MDGNEERTENFSRELRDLMEWEEKENIKILNRLKNEGVVLGLDGHVEEFANIREARNQKLEKLIAKYNLPSGTKLKLW